MTGPVPAFGAAQSMSQELPTPVVPTSPTGFGAECVACPSSPLTHALASRACSAPAVASRSKPAKRGAGSAIPRTQACR